MRLNMSETDMLPSTRRTGGQKRGSSVPEPPPAMNIACHQAFTAVELLESIFLHLEMGDLLRIQRVSRHWQAVIQSSPSLQRIQYLGFVPKSGELSRFVYNNHREPHAASCTPNPISTKELPVRDIPESPSTASLGILPEVPGEEHIPIDFNPIFPSDGQTIRMRTSQFRTKPDARESWLNMYLTQMPCSHVHAGLYYIRKREWKSRFGLIRRSDEPVLLHVSVDRKSGVKARDVLESLRDACGEDSRRWQRIDIRVPWTTKA